jgi:hypothetical protein
VSLLQLHSFVGHTILLIILAGLLVGSVPSEWETEWHLIVNVGCVSMSRLVLKVLRQ